MKKHVLVIDDDRDIRISMREFLEFTHPKEGVTQPMDLPMTIQVNGASYHLSIDTRTTILDVPVEQIELQIGDSTLPEATLAGGSSGLSHWGSAIVETARLLRARLSSEYGGVVPAEGVEVTGRKPDTLYYQQFARFRFGAQFAEVRVHEQTGEVRVPRLLGMFDVGRVINPKTARSQLLGGMTMGLSMALQEHGVLDPRFGHVVNQDFAGYHIATNADVGSVEAYWVDEEDLC